jgi:serine/threonine protein kinase
MGEIVDSGPQSDTAGSLGTERRRFRIHRCLGRGGFGEVYRATMESSSGVNTEVAVKVLRADIDPGSDSVKRLRDEGRLLGALSHPAILRVHDLVLLDERVSLVTEYIEGEDLDAVIAAGVGLRALILVVGEVASALSAAWSAPSPISGAPLNLIHRDIKPANIRIGRHGEVKLLDFGIARATNVAREAQTANDEMMGSYLYMAPERYHEDAINPPSDIFALGAILFEGCTGTRFFEGMTLKQVYVFMLSARKFQDRLNDVIADLASQDVPPPVLLLLQRMMHPDPRQRPSAGEVANICEDLSEELEGPTLKRWCRDRLRPEALDIQGSLTGKILDAGSFMTEMPTSPGTDVTEAVGEVSAPEPVPPEHQVVPAPRRDPQSLGIDIGQLPDFNEPAFEFDPADQPTEEVQRAGVIDDDAEFERELLARGAARRRRQGLAGLALLLVSVGLVLGAVFLTSALTTEASPLPVPELQPTGDIEAEPADLVEEPEPTEAAPPAPVERPPEKASEPEALPVPRRRPEVGLSDEGWALVGAAPEAAKAKFNEALALAPDHPDARYGLGYVLLNEGNLDAALPHLCQALASGQTDIVTDVRGLLARSGGTCD